MMVMIQVEVIRMFLKCFGLNYFDNGDNDCSHLATRVDIGKAVPDVANTEVEFCLAGV